MCVNSTKNMEFVFIKEVFGLFVGNVYVYVTRLPACLPVKFGLAVVWFCPVAKIASLARPNFIRSISNKREHPLVESIGFKISAVHYSHLACCWAYDYHYIVHCRRLEKTFSFSTTHIRAAWQSFFFAVVVFH